MSRHELRATLDKLRAEVAELRFRDPRDRERMQALIAGLERQLRRSDEAGREELLDLTSQTLKQFEVEHPNLTALLSRIVSALSAMGI